jgi:hypothetical protein
MATTSFDSCWSVGATRFQVPTGCTLALFIQPQQGQLGWQLKLLTGGTCEILPTGIGSSILGLNFSTTVPIGNLASLSTQGYMLQPTPEVLKIAGPASFYLSSTGATSVVAALLFKGQGY